MEHAEETTVHRRILEVEKEETDELKQKYKVNLNTGGVVLTNILPIIHSTRLKYYKRLMYI